MVIKCTWLVSGWVYIITYVLVKAPLQVLYEKMQHEGWGQVAKPSAVFATRLHPEYCIFSYIRCFY